MMMLDSKNGARLEQGVIELLTGLLHNHWFLIDHNNKCSSPRPIKLLLGGWRMMQDHTCLPL